MGHWDDERALGNAYTYVGNNPLNYVDTFGTATRRPHRCSWFGGTAGASWTETTVTPEVCNDTSSPAKLSVCHTESVEISVGLAKGPVSVSAKTGRSQTECIEATVPCNCCRAARCRPCFRCCARNLIT